MYKQQYLLSYKSGPVCTYYDTCGVPVSFEKGVSRLRGITDHENSAQCLH